METIGNVDFVHVFLSYRIFSARHLRSLGMAAFMRRTLVQRALVAWSSFHEDFS